MLRGNNGNNTVTPPFPDYRFQYPSALANQSQLYGHLPSDHVNYFGTNNNINMSSSLLPNKGCNNSHVIAPQFSLNGKICRDETDHKCTQNHVSTGLKLSYDDDEKNSSISSSSGSMMIASTDFSSLNSELRKEFDRQDQELNHLIKTQEENMIKGLRDITQRHTSSFLTVLEQKVTRQLQQKNLELETTNRRNKELVENVKKVSSDAQNWCYMAKYNESVVNYLKNNLQQAMESSNRVKEGFGENDTDDATSNIDPNNNLASGPHRSKKNDMICRSCRGKEVQRGEVRVLHVPSRYQVADIFTKGLPLVQRGEVRVLHVPSRYQVADIFTKGLPLVLFEDFRDSLNIRLPLAATEGEHLCLCKDCEGFVSVCPVCKMIKTASFEVYLS